MTPMVLMSVMGLTVVVIVFAMVCVYGAFLDSWLLSILSLLFVFYCSCIVFDMFVFVFSGSLICSCFRSSDDICLCLRLCVLCVCLVVCAKILVLCLCVLVALVFPACSAFELPIVSDFFPSSRGDGIGVGLERGRSCRVCVRSVGKVSPQKRQCGINGHLATKMEGKGRREGEKQKEMKVRRDLRAQAVEH